MFNRLMQTLGIITVTAAIATPIWIFITRMMGSEYSSAELIVARFFLTLLITGIGWLLLGGLTIWFEWLIYGDRHNNKECNEPVRGVAKEGEGETGAPEADVQQVPDGQE